MPQVIGPKTIIVASKDTLSRSLGNEATILHTASCVCYGLNPLGARIWSLLAKPCSVEELRAAVVARYEVEPSRCEADLLALLEDMQTEGLIAVIIGSRS